MRATSVQIVVFLIPIINANFGDAIETGRVKRGFVEALDHEYGYGIAEGAIVAPTSGLPIPSLEHGTIALISEADVTSSDQAASVVEYVEEINARPPVQAAVAIAPAATPIAVSGGVPSEPFLIQEASNGPAVIEREIPVPVPVNIPTTIKRTLTVAVPVRVPVPIPRNVPVPIPQPYPYIITRQVPFEVPRPYPVPLVKSVPVPVHQPYPVQVPVPVEVKQQQSNPVGGVYVAAAASQIASYGAGGALKYH